MSINAALKWLDQAQFDEGGFSAGYSFSAGWMPPYPETTGYLVPTLLAISEQRGADGLRNSALEAARWLVRIQDQSGWYPGKYIVSDRPMEPSVFNTGQIMQGLSAAFQATADERYREALLKSAEWVASVQEENGSWKEHAYNGIPHTYYSRVAWPMIEAGQLLHREDLAESGKAQLVWTLDRCNDVGWFDESGFLDHSSPLTHTIAYTIEGLLEGGVLLSESRFVDAAERSASALLSVFEENHFLPARFSSRWLSSDSWACVSGNAQISAVWLRLFQITRRDRFLSGGKEMNSWLCASQVKDTSRSVPAGGLKGSYPVWGDYDRFRLPMHAVKFFLDAIMLEDCIERKKKC